MATGIQSLIVDRSGRNLTVAELVSAVPEPGALLAPAFRLAAPSDCGCWCLIDAQFIKASSCKSPDFARHLLLSCNKGLLPEKERYPAMPEAPDGQFDPKFDASGLLSAVVVDSSTKAVLMVAFMDAEALAATRASGLAHFQSRSRGRLWKKGESSGNELVVERMLVDCDQDAIVLECRPAGPTCHTGATSCFFRQLEGDALRHVTT
jgi:phosphoribosyl-AMP cyclohydrolase